ncbi:LuxR C-terminal-related transcriptional regulator [Streptomyces sp. NPDC059070]|uniref:helix-turn-helix transcriptional regulator n=1 Tax=Streptomyces sp. NPDC059070 TaxID=3346713 RepID=UPI0036A0DEA0
MSKSGKPSPLSAAMDLPEHAWLLYRRALRGEPIQSADPGFADLDAVGLLVHDPVRDAFVVAELRLVQERLEKRATDQLIQAAEGMSAIPQFLHLVADLRERHSEAGGSFDRAVFLDGLDNVHAEMAAAVDAAQVDVLTAHPAKRPRRLVANSQERDLALLRRGVAMRTMYHPVNRGVPAVREWAQAVTDAGAQVRTLSSPFLKMVIVDSSHAFITDFVQGRDHTQGAWLIRHPAIVAFIREVFEQTWQQADPWDGTSGRAPVSPAYTTPTLRTMLRGVCAGKSQTQIGKQLGVSERTVSGQLSALREQLGLQTSAQLVYWWATSPERELD